MKVWFPGLYTEAHRTGQRQQELINALRDVGVVMRGMLEKDCELCFCGSIFINTQQRQSIRRCGIPVVHYNWDLYPWVVENRQQTGWPGYLRDLARAASVLVPNEGTARRTLEMTGRTGTVVYSPVKVWDVPPRPPGTPEPRSYVLDVMRDYKWDRGYTFPQEACTALGVELVRTQTKEPWDRFRWLVANAGCLVSAVEEASTGGLTLLEGYAHGVPVVVNASPLNGANEYFGSRCFPCSSDAEDIAAGIRNAMSQRDPVDVAERRKWVEDNYSDHVFANRLKEEFTRCLNSRR